jgi:2,4-dienoyl-CoA reductase-like NADH-dependent reductase (Old Yellow Enzyme family)
MIGTPLTLPNGLTLKNRVAKAAMTENIANPIDGDPNERHFRLYERWSDGGAGLLITGNVMIDRRFLEQAGNVVLDAKSNFAAFQEYARRAKSGGAAVFMQVNHPGRQSSLFVTRKPVAPSSSGAVKMIASFAKPRALEADEIEELVRTYGVVAARAEKAGFDGIQIHSAHGYLGSQFLSPLTNLRTDKWGGSLENRARFLLESIRAVRRETSPGFAVSVKLNSSDFQRGGFTHEESIEVARLLDAEGIDLLEISGGNYESPALLVGVDDDRAGSTKAREAYFFEYAEGIRQAFRRPLMLTGGLRSASVMNEVLASDAVDVIGLARPLAVDPDFPAKLVTGDQSIVSPVTPVRFINKQVSAMAEAGYHGAQLERMGDGKEPDAHLSPFRATTHYLGAQLAGFFRLMRRPALPRQLTAET